MTQLRADPGCICEGNLRAIIKECSELLGKKYLNREGQEVVFFGIVYGDDDLYYGMWSKEAGMHLLSCVVDIDGWGYKKVEEIEP